jgi:hypothetical protein
MRDGVRGIEVEDSSSSPLKPLPHTVEYWEWRSAQATKVLINVMCILLGHLSEVLSAETHSHLNRANLSSQED